MAWRKKITLAARGVEVVTEVATDGTGAGFWTVIHGGLLDGERFGAATALGALLMHKHAAELARAAEREAARDLPARFVESMREED